MSNNEYNNLASNMADLTLASQIPNLKSLIPLEEQILAKCAKDREMERLDEFQN